MATRERRHADAQVRRGRGKASLRRRLSPAACAVFGGCSRLSCSRHSAVRYLLYPLLYLGSPLASPLSPLPLLSCIVLYALLYCRACLQLQQVQETSKHCNQCSTLPQPRASRQARASSQQPSAGSIRLLAGTVCLLHASKSRSTTCPCMLGACMLHLSCRRMHAGQDKCLIRRVKTSA